MAMLAAICSLGSDWPLQSTSMTIEEIMTEAHKKPSELLKKVATGAATDQQKQRLLELYQALAAHAPPKGDTNSWRTKTELLTRAARSAVEGKADADKELAKAANCKACHEAHK
jgi:hypothetical protein